MHRQILRAALARPAQFILAAAGFAGVALNLLLQRAFWSSLAGACVIAMVAATPILMSGVMDRGFEIAKQSLAEPLAVLGLGAILLAGGLNWLREASAATKIAAASLIMFLLLAVVSTVFSEYPEVAFFGGYYRREGLLAWTVYGAFFFAVLGWARSRGRVEGFLDALLLASVIPAAYALQQRLDLDFYPLGMREFARPGSTLGSPLFLAAYLGVLLPITISRCWLARRAWPDFTLWLMVSLMQICGLLVTQTRGPLVAVWVGLLMLACFAAGYARARRIFAGAAVVFAVVVATLIAINSFPGPRLWAQEVPVVGRLVFNLDRDSGAATRRASSSAASRLAIWGAGIDTFVAAPLETKLLGYGPESAYMHYFAYMPASVMRMAGFGANHSYDRMHADTLDVSLNFGLIAWLAYCLFYGAVMYAAARALFGLSGRAPPRIFFTCALLGGVLSAVAAALAGLAAAAAPAFGLGAGFGVFLFLAGCAWRALKHGVPQIPSRLTGRWTTLAALVSALMVFWVDAQVNIPVLTTRLISFAIAALILIVADGVDRERTDNTGANPASERNLWVWGIAFALVAGCAIGLPAVLFNAGSGAQEMQWLRRALPILSLLVVAALAAWSHARRPSYSSVGVVRDWLAIGVGLPLIYAMGHLLLLVKIHADPNFEQALSISIATFAAPVFMLGLCIAYALHAGRGSASAANEAFVSRVARWSICAVAMSMLLVAMLDWRATRADVASWFAQQAASKQPQLGEQLLAEAIRLMPYERYYRRQQVFDLLGRAAADISKSAENSAQIPVAMRNLAAAETAARTAALQFPRDPWVIGALANVLQVKALRSLRPLDPAGGLRAAQEANQLFAHAHRMYPGEPLIVRNWAQLTFDQGNLPDAYRLLDVMEKLIPEDPEPYAERVAMAKKAHDQATIFATLTRARAALEPKAFDGLLTVANSQQN